MRKATWLVLVIAVLVAGVMAVNAEDSSYQVVDGQLLYTDGRVNTADVDAPVAVYCRFDHPDADDLDYSELNSIEFLALNYANNGELALSVDAAQIDAVSATPAEDTLIAADNGLSLYRATTGSLYVVGPANGSGTPYIFAWDLGDEGC